MPDNDTCIVARESIAIVATGYSISKYANEKDSLVVERALYYCYIWFLDAQQLLRNHI